MESFIKRSQRNKLWAHARNKTIENLLVGTLQHLNEEYDRDCRHYLRIRHRIQRELVELRSLPEDFNFARSKDVGKESVTNSGTKAQTIKESQGYRPIESKRFLQSAEVRNDDTHLTLKECNIGNNSPVFDKRVGKRFVNVDQFVDHEETLDNNLHNNVNPLHISRQHLVDSNGDTTAPIGESRSRTWHEVDKAMPRHGNVCKYKEVQKGNVPCQHFPCQIPRTYHSLGYRREDLIPWLRETRNGAFTIHSTTNKPNIKIPRHIKLPKVTSSEYLDTVRPSSQMDNPLPNWRKNSLKLKVLFQPMEGPIFTTKPSDPILEQIRIGSLEEIQSKPPMTRKTVTAKLRGLKQLVVEMKYRNDLTKPADWAVNYGARLPTRVLLNPVFPV